MDPDSTKPQPIKRVRERIAEAKQQTLSLIGQLDQIEAIFSDNNSSVIEEIDALVNLKVLKKEMDRLSRFFDSIKRERGQS